MDCIKKLLNNLKESEQILSKYAMYDRAAQLKKVRMEIMEEPISILTEEKPNSSNYAKTKCIGDVIKEQPKTEDSGQMTLFEYEMPCCTPDGLQKPNTSLSDAEPADTIKEWNQTLDESIKSNEDKLKEIKDRRGGGYFHDSF